jgi:hypothetical protein
MQRIPLALAEPGMVLAEAVLYSSGMVLAGVGVELTASMIERMAKSGIGALVVEGDADGSGGEFKAVLDKLPHLFRRYTRDAFMMTLHNMLQHYFSRKAREAEAAAAARKAARETAAAGEATAAQDGSGEH